jgi:hypothetical protein
MVFFTQDVRQGPVAESVYIAQFAIALKDLLGPFPGQREGLGERAEQFDDLCDMVVIFAILGSRLRVE